MTNWELGNDIMCSLVDKMDELAKECSHEQEDVAKLLRGVALDFGYLVNRLMDDRLCPERQRPLHTWEYFNAGARFIKLPRNPR